MNYNNFSKKELIALIGHKNDQLDRFVSDQLSYNGLLNQFKDEYLSAIKASIKAGEAIMNIYNSNDFGTTYKDDTSPVTYADKEADAIIKLMLNTKLPILSEESKIPRYKIRKKWKKLWIVDPLDGTKEFVKRNGDFTVNIALVIQGITVFGVIYAPVTKMLYFGMQRVGAYKACIDYKEDVTNIQFDKLVTESTRLPEYDVKRYKTLVVTKSHMNDETKKLIDTYKRGYPDLNTISRGSSLKFCAIAEGSADIYPRFSPTMEWDTAAGHAIVEASGGKVLKCDSTALTYNKENLLNDEFIVSMEDPS